MEIVIIKLKKINFFFQDTAFENIPDVETLEDSAIKRPRNYKVQIIGGVFADIRIRIRDQRDNLIHDSKRY